MRKKTLLIILLLILSLTHCKREKSIEEIRVQEKGDILDIRFDLIKEVRIEQGDEILETPFLFYDKTSNTIGVYGYKSPKKDLVINIFNTNLDFEKTKIFKSGQGPGDAGTGTLIFPFKDKIIVSDNTLRRISTFDKDFNFIKFDIAKGIGRFINDGNHILCLRRLDEKKTRFDFSIISYPDFKGKRLISFGPYNRSNGRDKKNRIALGTFPVFDNFYKNNEVFFFDLKNYTITKYSLAGKVLKKIIVAHKTLKAPEKMKKTWVKEWLPGDWAVANVTFADIIQPGVVAIPLGKGFAVLRRKDYSMVCKSGLVEGDYFDYHLNLFGKIKAPCFYRAFDILYKPIYTHYFENGFLYLITEDKEGFKLAKWQVKE
jgi:hypothetical protein